MLSLRQTIQLISWPDPLVQERIEDMGFFYDSVGRAWIRFCDEEELTHVSEWLKRHRLSFRVKDAPGRGQTKRHPRLSDGLVVKGGGSATQCGLCGVRGVPCRLWVEGDDTDSVEYPNAARFYMCGQCVQTQMQPHPRLYAPAEDQL